MANIEIKEPSEIRKTACDLISSANLADLAHAIESGNRIKAMSLFCLWLMEGNNPELHLRQMGDQIIWELSERRSKSDLNELHSRILSSLLKD